MSEENRINFWQGQTNLLCDNNQNNEDEQNNKIKTIKGKIAELSNIKNINFLLGAGASSDAIPTMKKMKESLIKRKKFQSLDKLYKEFSNDDVNNDKKDNEEDNLEHLLGVMYAKQYYLKNTKTEASDDANDINALIKEIEEHIYEEINIDMSSEVISKQLKLYKDFYQKIVLRNKDLARVNIFTTNSDLFNEKALDDLNINYNNGFGGGLERVFNPARFRYTFSQKIDVNLEKFEPLENMVYLYKLHGSISWIEKKGNSLFDIQEIAVKGGEKKPKNSVLIYPTALKQEQSLALPYSDLIREFQTKLCQSNSVLFVIGYSFSDEHINNIIYQSLTANASLSIVIFGEYSQCPLTKINDSRIYRIFGEDNEDKKDKIHYFEYIVKNLLPNLDENKEKTLLDTFVKKLKEQNGKK